LVTRLVCFCALLCCAAEASGRRQLTPSLRTARLPLRAESKRGCFERGFGRKACPAFRLTSPTRGESSTRKKRVGLARAGLPAQKRAVPFRGAKNKFSQAEREATLAYRAPSSGAPSSFARFRPAALLGAFRLNARCVPARTSRTMAGTKLLPPCFACLPPPPFSGCLLCCHRSLAESRSWGAAACCSARGTPGQQARQPEGRQRAGDSSLGCALGSSSRCLAPAAFCGWPADSFACCFWLLLTSSGCSPRRRVPCYRSSKARPGAVWRARFGTLWQVKRSA